MDPEAPTQVPGSPDAYAPTSPAPASPDDYAPTASDDVKDVKMSTIRHGSQDDIDPDAPTQVPLDDDDEVEERQSVAASDDDEPAPPASPRGSEAGSKPGLLDWCQFIIEEI